MCSSDLWCDFHLANEMSGGFHRFLFCGPLRRISFYNPKFFAKLTKEQRAGVIKHEFYHLVLGHVSDRLPEGKMTRNWNIASDLAINSHIANELPDIACIPGRGPFADLPMYESAEWYYNNLPKKDDKNKGDGQGGDGQGDPGDGQIGRAHV